LISGLEDKQIPKPAIMMAVILAMLHIKNDRKIGAGDGIRTHDPNLGKVVLYH
jgi:hypothetical protein